MKCTPLYWILWIFSSGPVAGDGGSPPASLIIIPNRSQFLEYKSFNVSCEVQVSSSGWILRRFTTTQKLLTSGDTMFNPGSYFINSAKLSDSGVYWCESGSGEHSNTVNITVTDGPVILESPALPVTEGHSVTLSCRYQTIPSNLTADFYKDGSLIRTEPTGEITIPAVNKSDEGWYWCRNSNINSPKSFMRVSATPSTPPKPPSSPSPTHTPSALFLPLSLSLSGLAILAIILLVLFCFWKKKKDVAQNSTDVTHTVRTKLDQTSRKTRGEVIYADIHFTEKSQHNRKRERPLPVEPDVVYSSVRPGAGHSAGPRKSGASR